MRTEPVTARIDIDKAAMRASVVHLLEPFRMEKTIEEEINRAIDDFDYEAIVKEAVREVIEQSIRAAILHGDLRTEIAQVVRKLIKESLGG